MSKLDDVKGMHSWIDAKELLPGRAERGKLIREMVFYEEGSV